MKTKGQISMEYMMIVGFVAVITLPLIIIYYTYSAETKDQIAADQLQQVSKRLVDAAEAVYYLGEPSQTTLKVYIPSGIIDSSVANKEVVFKIKTTAGISDIVGISPVSLTGQVPKSQGLYSITLKATTAGVELSYS